MHEPNGGRNAQGSLLHRNGIVALVPLLLFLVLPLLRLELLLALHVLQGPVELLLRGGIIAGDGRGSGRGGDGGVDAGLLDNLALRVHEVDRGSLLVARRGDEWLIATVPTLLVRAIRIFVACTHAHMNVEGNLDQRFM